LRARFARAARADAAPRDGRAQALRALLRPPLVASAAANAEAVTLHCNAAAALLKAGACPAHGARKHCLTRLRSAGRHADAAAECTAALASAPRCAKALFRRAQARARLPGRAL
jgi:hypothetical protein